MLFLQWLTRPDIILATHGVPHKKLKTDNVYDYVSCDKCSSKKKWNTMRKTSGKGTEFNLEDSRTGVLRQYYFKWHLKYKWVLGRKRTSCRRKNTSTASWTREIRHVARCTTSRLARRGRPATEGGHCSVCHGCSLTQNKVYLLKGNLNCWRENGWGRWGAWSSILWKQRPRNRLPRFLHLMWYHWDGNTAGAVACEIPMRHLRTDVR